jgi:mono/diheme cytochrome c family protein
MTTPGWWRSPLALAGASCSIFVILLDVVLRSVPGPATSPALFLGRFHPLAVHLPIGVILLVAVAEVASLFPRYRERVDGGIALTLPVLLAGAVAAFLLGHLLARGGGFPARTLVLHRRMELFAVVGVGASTVAWAYQASRATIGARNVYRVVFGLTLAVLSAGAHFGGTMTRGDNYLSKHAPAFLAPLLGGVESRERPAPAAPAAPKNEPLVFADVVLPILRERCVECHGEEETKGELRLDSLAAIRRGGENGAVVVAGSPDESPLLQRMLLPMDDDDRMPPEGKPGPTEAERDAIRFWIERGGTDTLRVRDALAPVNARGVLERALGGPAASGIPAQNASESITAAPPSASSALPNQVAPPANPAKRDAPSREPDAAPGATTPSPEPGEAERQAPVRSSGSAQAVLAEKCGECHSAKKQKGKLRVDSLEALMAGGKHGPAVVPGRPAESLLVQRTELPLEADGHMPPKDKPQLTASERALLVGFVRGLSASPTPAEKTALPATPSGSEPAAGASAAAPGPAVSDADAAPPAPEPDAALPDVEAASRPDPELVARLPTRVDLFASAVARLLMERCAKCHTGKFPAGNLSVADHASLVRGGNGGPAVVHGDLEKSSLWQRTSLPLSDSDHMPPEEEPQLEADELALLRAFILNGGAVGATVATAELPAGAVRALASRSSALRPPPPATPRTAGCGACAVGESTKSPIFSGFGPAAVALVWFLRRRSRGRPSAGTSQKAERSGGTGQRWWHAPPPHGRR